MKRVILNMDSRVLQTQQWLNETYGGMVGYNRVTEDGITGWNTIYGLTRAIQIELNIYPTADNFGPTTMSKFPDLSRQEVGEEPTNLNYILQGGFWCKGYNPGGFTGNFFSITENAVIDFQRDVGFTLADGVVDGKLMKAILNTDGYRLSSSSGRPVVRIIQQFLNREYGSNFDYIPTNGVYERQSNRALIYALQVESGLGNIANGNFGDSTIAHCPTLSFDYSTPGFTRILQSALACNGLRYETPLFSDRYTTTIESAVRNYQEFMTLPATGVADVATIKQLLTSNGLTSRPAIACDASTIINDNTARTLVNNGYKVIGRYLTGTVSGIRSKAMTREEIAILLSHNIRIFPIFQDGNAEAEYFVPGKGRDDAYKAINAANELGFNSGTTIYFAIDFDAYDCQITNLILPYMREITRVFNALEDDYALPSYKLGVYGPRNVCIRCASDPDVGTVYSFVSNMSTGFSGNLGFPMPTNWTFSQFYEMDIGSEEGLLRIDKNDYSGRDTGVTSVRHNLIETNPKYDALFSEWNEIARSLPIMESRPFLFTTEFTFDQTYTVFDNFMFKVDVMTSTSYSLPGDDSVTISVKDDKPTASIKTILGDAYGELSQQGLNMFEKQLSDLSAAIGNGILEVKFDASVPSELKIEIAVYKDEISIEGGGTTELGVTVTYTIKSNPYNDGPEGDLEPIVIIAGFSVIVLAITAIVILGGAIAGGLAALGALFATLLA